MVESTKSKLGNLPKLIRTDVFSLKGDRDKDLLDRATRITANLEFNLFNDLGDALHKAKVELKLSDFESLFYTISEDIYSDIFFFLKLKQEEEEIESEGVI